MFGLILSFPFCFFAPGNFERKKIQGFLTLIVAILFMGGIQLMFLGIIGEYLGRIYFESKHRPLYLIREMSNFDQTSTLTPTIKTRES
jgi:hypothetical protein